MRVREGSAAGIGLTLLFLLWVSVCSADIPRWLSVMPLHEHAADELAADAAALGNDTFVDGIVRFEKIGDNVVRLHSRISVQEAAIFRCRVRK